MTVCLRQCANYYRSIQEQSPLPEFGSRTLQCFYGIHAAGIKGSCCSLAPLRALRFSCSVSRCYPDTLVLVKMISGVGKDDCSPFLQTGSIFTEKAFQRHTSLLALLMTSVCGSFMVQRVWSEIVSLFNTICIYTAFWWSIGWQTLLSINLDNCPAEKTQTDNRSWHVSSPIYTLGISNKIKTCWMM